MTKKLAGLFIGVAIGFIMAWARLSDPAVIRSMLLLREPHVFLLMGSAALVAGSARDCCERPALARS